MAYQKMNSKGEFNLLGVVFTLLIVMGMFFGMFLYLNQKANEGNVAIDSKYNTTFTDLQEVQGELDDNVNDIKNNLDQIREAENPLTFAWNGMLGLGSTLKLSVNFVTNAVATVTAIIIPLDFIPIQVKVLFLIGVIAGIVILVLSILKGEPSLK